MQNSEDIAKSDGISPYNTSQRISNSQGGVQGVNGNFNSINIRKLVQQSNNYWHAERTFFNSDKNRNNIDELERMANSIENIITPKGNINHLDLNKYAYINDQTQLNVSNHQHRDSFCGDVHEWPDQSIDERENIDINMERRSENIHNIGGGSMQYLDESSKLRQNNVVGGVSQNIIGRCPVPQPGQNRQNEVHHRRIQSAASGDIKSLLTANNLSNLKSQQQPSYGQNAHSSSGQNSFNNLSVNNIANQNLVQAGVKPNGNNMNMGNNGMKNTMVINMNINRNNLNGNVNAINNTFANATLNVTQNNSNNTTFNSTQTGFSQKKLQDITFSFSYVRKGASIIAKNLFPFNSSTLQIVDLSFNKFRDVPSEILEFPNLRVLKLDTNLIKVLNPDLFAKVKLEYFSISNNLLFEIPQRITEWSDCIKYLDVSLNRIEDLSVLPELKKLQSLHIHNNDFRYVPCNISVFESSLLELSLDWFQYVNPPLQLRQSGLHGARIIQKLMHFLRMYMNQDQSISNIIQKYRQGSNKQDSKEVNFMEVISYLSNPNLPFDITIKDSKDNNKSLSHKASEREEIGCLISILENQYDLINAVDSEGHTPLSLSILNEKFFSAKTLISNGANVNLGGSNYGTCLNLATIKYQYYLVQDLLKRGANPNASDNEGNTPLHYIMTIFHRDTTYSAKICDLLLQFRADPNIKNKDDWAPIHLVARRGQADAFAYIQNYNKYLSENSYNNTKLPEFANLPGVKEGTFINQAQQNSGLIQVRDLSSNPGPLQYMPFHINLKGGKEKQSPLHIACMHSCYDLVNLLLKSGADIFSRNLHNKIPLHMCMRDNYLYKLLKMKESEVFNKFYSLYRQIVVTSPTLNTQETPYKNNTINRTLTQQSLNQSSPKQQQQISFQERLQLVSNNSQATLFSQKQQNKQESNTHQLITQNSLSSFQIQQQLGNNSHPTGNALQVANIIQNNLDSLSNQMKPNSKQNIFIKNSNTFNQISQQISNQSQSQQCANESNKMKTSTFSNQQQKPSFIQQQIKSQISANISDCEIVLSDNDDNDKQDPNFEELNVKKFQQKDQGDDNEYDVSESQMTNRVTNFANLQGMNVKGNSKNYNYIQNFEKEFKNGQQNADKNKQLRGQLIRNSLLLNKQKIKSGEEQNESIRAEELEGEFDDACVDNEDDSINKNLNYHIPSNPNYFQQNNIEQISTSTATNQKLQIQQQQNQNYYMGKSFDPFAQETRSQPNQKGMFFNDELDEDMTKEEEFFNGDIDESKSMFELISTKKKIMNQSLPYAPNNIQQLNYIQTVNRTNIQKIQAQKAHHSRSKSNIDGIFQPKKLELKPDSNVKGKELNTSKQNTQIKTLAKDDLTLQNKEQQRGLIKTDGLDAPPQIITPQHISFFNYLLEKTKNMHEYYSVSLQNYKKNILSEFNTLYEKFRYFVIMMKLQVEYQNMILHLINEKEILQSILGETPLFNLGIIDKSNSNLMIMKMLLDIAENLKCESHSLLLIQKDYPTPTELNFFGQAINANNNITYWMRQYEETIHDTSSQSNLQEDKVEMIEIIQNRQNEEEQMKQQSPQQLQEDIKLYERENSVLKENIIYQLGNYDFNESIDYLEKEIKSSDTSILNAFESCQSFFKIRESLYQKQTDINDNKMRKNKAGVEQKPKQKAYQEESKALFSFPSNVILNNQNKISKATQPPSLTQVSKLLTNQNDSSIKINQADQNKAPSSQKGNASNNSSLMLTEQSEAVASQRSNQQQFNQAVQYKQNAQNLTANQQNQFLKPSLSSFTQSIPSSGTLQPQQQSQKSIQKSDSSLNNITDVQFTNPDLRPTRPLIFQQNSNTIPQQDKFIKPIQNSMPSNLAQKQVVLTEKALNKQISTHTSTIPTVSSQIKDKIFSNDNLNIFDKKNSLTNNKRLNHSNQSQLSDDDSNNNSFNLIAPMGAQLDYNIHNPYIDPKQKQEQKQQNSIFSNNQQRPQQQQILIPISQFKQIGNNAFTKKQ